MKRNYIKWKSQFLEQDMEILSFGHYGIPLLVLPTSKGKFYEWEDFGMISSLRTHIEAGRIKVFCVDSVDAQSWYNPLSDTELRIKRHVLYEKYIIEEVIPHIEENTQTPNIDIYLTGASFGAYHAVNLYLRFPNKITAAVGMSGNYDISNFFSPYEQEMTGMFNPVKFLDMASEETLNILRKKVSLYLFCGQGAYEEETLKSTKMFSQKMLKYNIPHLLDIWGEDVDHHWYWWQQQINYFINKLMP